MTNVHIAKTSDLERMVKRGSGWICEWSPQCNDGFETPDGWVGCSSLIEPPYCAERPANSVAETVGTFLQEASQESNASGLSILLVSILREVVKVSQSAFLPVLCHSLRWLTRADTFPEH